MKADTPISEIEICEFVLEVLKFTSLSIWKVYDALMPVGVITFGNDSVIHMSSILLTQVDTYIQARNFGTIQSRGLIANFSRLTESSAAVLAHGCQLLLTEVNKNTLRAEACSMDWMRMTKKKTNNISVDE